MLTRYPRCNQSATGRVQSTLIPYVRPADLRRELNDQFRSSHPELDPSITLSKIRRLKALLVAAGQVGRRCRHGVQRGVLAPPRKRWQEARTTQIWSGVGWGWGTRAASFFDGTQEVDLEASTMACAFAFVERLILTVHLHGRLRRCVRDRSGRSHSVAHTHARVRWDHVARVCPRGRLSARREQGQPKSGGRCVLGAWSDVPGHSGLVHKHALRVRY